MELIDEWLEKHEEEMVEDIRKLVKIPSVACRGMEKHPYGEACSNAADCLVEMAESYGLTAYNFENRCAVITYGNEIERVEIWGHLDVVPEGRGWTYPPYECIRIDDFLIGRGVSDNKGAVIAVLYTLRFLKEAGCKLKFSVRQVCGLCEEIGMDDANHYLKYYGIPDYAFVSDCRFPLCYGEKGRYVVVLESCVLDCNIIQKFNAGDADNSVVAMASAMIKGTILNAKGTAGHAAAPEKCKNPIADLADKCKGMIFSENKNMYGKEIRCMDFLSNTCREGYGKGFGIECETPEFGKLTCQGTVVKYMENRLSVTFDIRYPANIDGDNLLTQIDQVSHQYGFSMKVIKQHKGYLRNLENPWIHMILKSYRTVTGDMSAPYVIGGNTYAGYLGNSAVPFGPVIQKDFSHLGLPDGHGCGHGIDEVQSIESLKTAVKVYVEALKSWSEI